MELIEAFKVQRMGDVVSYRHVEERLWRTDDPTLDAEVKELISQGLVVIMHSGDAANPVFYLTETGWAEVCKIQKDRPMQIAIEALQAKRDGISDAIRSAEGSLREYGESAVACKARIAALKGQMRELHGAIMLLERGAV